MQTKNALHGEMTEAKIRETIADIKEVLKEYGSLERQNIPLDVYVKKVYSHLDIIAVLEQTIIPNGKNLYTLEYSYISEDDAKNVYTAYRENVQNLNKNPEVQKKINQMTKHIQIPLAYYSEFTTDQLDYYQIYLFLVMIFFMVIITPVFATEYQTGFGSDSALYETWKISSCHYKDRCGIYINFRSICGRNDSLFYYNAYIIWRGSI